MPTDSNNSQSDLNTLNLNRQLTIAQANTVMQDHLHLIDYNYRKWFYKHLYRIGEQEFRKAGSLCKEGREPKKLFTKLIKEAPSLDTEMLSSLRESYSA